MAQPPAYSREKNFTLNSGRETDHAALNAELDRASNSINDIRGNLAILQADDGMLRPAVVTADSISEGLRISLVEGVVMDAQAMLDRSLAAADASSASAKEAKASETGALSSKVTALQSALAAQQSASEAAASAAKAKQVNADWNASEGPAKILNKPATLAGYGISDALPVPVVDASADPLHLTVRANTIYQFGVLPVLTIEGVTNGFRESQIRFSSGPNVTTVTIPDTLKHVGEWEIEPNNDYIISILNNIAVLGKVIS